MKKTLKIFAAVMLVAAMVFSIASCGKTDLSKLNGDWTLSTINGQSPADKATEMGIPSYGLLTNFTLSGNTLTTSTYNPTAGEVAVSNQFTVEATANGFTATDSNGGKTSFVYDSAANTLSYTVGSETYVLTKGTTDIMAAVQAASGATAEGGEGEAAEGGEGAAEGGEDEGDYSEEE